VTVYFAQAGKRMKIGYTDGDRHMCLQATQTAHPERLRLVHVIDAADQQIERALQAAFAFCRIAGREWFDADGVTPYLAEGRDAVAIIDAIALTKLNPARAEALKAARTILLEDRPVRVQHVRGKLQAAQVSIRLDDRMLATLDEYIQDRYRRFRVPMSRTVALRQILDGCVRDGRFVLHGHDCECGCAARARVAELAG
jgi:hypothetical protein